MHRQKDGLAVALGALQLIGQQQVQRVARDLGSLGG